MNIRRTANKMKFKTLFIALIGLSYFSTTFAMDVVRCVVSERVDNYGNVVPNIPFIEHIVAFSGEETTVRTSGAETLKFNTVYTNYNRMDGDCWVELMARNYGYDSSFDIRTYNKTIINKMPVGTSANALITRWGDGAYDRYARRLWTDQAICTVEFKE